MRNQVANQRRSLLVPMHLAYQHKLVHANRFDE